MSIVTLNAVVPSSSILPFSEPALPRVKRQSEWNVSDSPPPARPAPPRLTSLVAQFADKEDLKTLGRKLEQIAQKLGKEALPHTVLGELASTPMDIDRASSYAAQTGSSVTLKSFIQDIVQLKLPTDDFSLRSLSDAVIDKAKESPMGNLSGALSWPIPLSTDEQRRLRLFAMNYADDQGDKRLVMQTKGLLLEFLHQRKKAFQSSVDPRDRLPALISSPGAQQMGKTLQQNMRGLPNESSATDYLLAALNVQLDPESITESRRNYVAGFDLGSNKFWGTPTSEVIEALADHLVEKGRVSYDHKLEAVHLLLGARSPIYLIQDVPSSVTYGSLAWFNLAVAAETIEAMTPGKVANMTFTQVMLAAEDAGLQNPAITESAQRKALIEWGVVNGLLVQKNDPEYTASELDTLVTEFNAHKSLLTTAAEAFDKDLPSRKEMALAELRKRFPDKEAMFNQKLIEIRLKGVIQEFGPHSMLDVVMTPNIHGKNMVYSATDPRVPLEQLNAEPGFGVARAFESQFKETIEQKKNAVRTTIQHLISQMPWEDRENLESGKISFFQKTATFPEYSKANQKLLIRTDLPNGDAAGYEIDFNAGAIIKIPADMAKEDSRKSMPYEKKAFDSGASEALLRAVQSTSSRTNIDSFNSKRTQLIADAFVKHINIDDPSIKKEAARLTTADKHRNASDSVGKFVLNLIPFYSAVDDFRQGNIGAGLVDLGLDAFGFLTAGAATAGKLTKIAGTTASTLNKVARSAKVIGAAAFSQINPLDGLDKVAWGAGKLVGHGFKKSAEWVQKLRGLNDSYDLLKTASNNHGVVATGVSKIAGESIEGAAVLKNGEWHAFDTDKMQPFGAPLQSFTPSTVAVRGQINQSFTDWLYRKLAGEDALVQGPPSVLGHYVPADFEKAMERARSPDNLQSFEFGYAHGDPHKVPGYSEKMNIIELQTLASHGFLSPEDLGALVKKIEGQKVKLTQDGFTLFQRDIQAAGGTVTPMPQDLYLSQVNIASRGECAGMVNALGLAINSENEAVFLGNMFKAAANPKAPEAARFIDDLRTFHNAVQDFDTYHMGKATRQIPYHEIASELAASAPPKILRINTQDHALLAGTLLRDNKPVWFYFDPNFGLAKFDTAQAMKNGLERTLNRGTSPFQHRALGMNPGVPEYRVSDFAASDFKASHSPSAVNRMVSQAL